MTFSLPDLPYAYDALEPYIDEETMHLHHDKHHQTYINNLNATLADYPRLAALSIEDLLADTSKIPQDIRQAVINNGGGHANHSFFWKMMTAESAGPSGDLATELDKTFGSVGDFKAKFKTAATGRFGSGWAWLVLDHGKLHVTATLNQDSPLSNGQVPIIGLDVWEHAYYLKYKNVRPEYVDAFWSVVNWEYANELFMAAKKAERELI